MGLLNKSFWTLNQPELKKKLRRDHLESLAVLAERKRTSRGEQLLSLTNDNGFFNEFFLERICLEELLRLPCVCKQLRNNTNRLDTWYSLLLKAMIRRRPRSIPLVIAKHDKAVKLFFGIPVGWKIPQLRRLMEDGKSYTFYGIAELKAAALAANGQIYKDLRNNIQLAIDDYNEKKCELQNSVAGMMGYDMTLKASLLADAEMCVRSAANAMITYNSTVCDEIRMHPCSVFKFKEKEFRKWEDFAQTPNMSTNVYEPSTPRPWVINMIEASDRTARTEVAP